METEEPVKPNEAPLPQKDVAPSPAPAPAAPRTELKFPWIEICVLFLFDILTAFAGLYFLLCFHLCFVVLGYLVSTRAQNKIRNTYTLIVKIIVWNSLVAFLIGMFAAVLLPPEMVRPVLSLVLIVVVYFLTLSNIRQAKAYLIDWSVFLNKTPLVMVGTGVITESTRLPGLFSQMEVEGPGALLFACFIVVAVIFAYWFNQMVITYMLKHEHLLVDSDAATPPNS